MHTPHQIFSFELQDFQDQWIQQLRAMADQIQELAYPAGIHRDYNPRIPFKEAEVRMLRAYLGNKAEVLKLVIVGHYRGAGLILGSHVIPENLRMKTVVLSNSALDEKQKNLYRALGIHHFALRGGPGVATPDYHFMTNFLSEFIRNNGSLPVAQTPDVST